MKNGIMAMDETSIQQAAHYYNDVCKRALETYGFRVQAAMVVEECSELIDALCKFLRGRKDVCEEDVITEIADVTIMCQQLAFHFGKDKVFAEIQRKIKRLEDRMNEKG